MRALLPALAAALDGSGPAVLPLPEGREGERLTVALSADDPKDADGVAVVVATSGSTGEPKGVLLTADALRASAAATHARLGGPGAWLLALPVTSIAGLQVVVRSLLTGSTPTVVDPTTSFGADSFATASAALRGARRYTALVPTQLRRLLDAGGPALAALTSYDAVLVGGAATPPALLELARQAGARVVTTYGMTETSGGCVYDGRALDGVAWQLEDDGLIRLGGPVLARGYLRRPDLTATAFRDGWFRTHDLGAVDSEGRLVVLGRTDDVIVTGGVNVAAPAVEAALGAHPDVAECAVVGLPDAEWGQRVTAFVVARDPAAPPDADDLRAEVASRLSRAAAPREVVVVDRLPLLASGKVDRRALLGTGSAELGR